MSWFCTPPYFFLLVSYLLKKNSNSGKEIFKFKGEIMKRYSKCIYRLWFLFTISDSCPQWYCTENYLYIYKMYFYTCTKIHLLIERSRFYHWLTSKQARNILLYVRVFNVVFSCSNEVRKKVKEENNKWLSIRFMWGEYIRRTRSNVRLPLTYFDSMSALPYYSKV